MDFTPEDIADRWEIIPSISFVEEKVQIFKKSKRNNYGRVKN